jgi:ribosomal-protein-alanine N-acetyltransferase
MLASTVTDDETSWKPDGIAKQYGEPAGEIFVPEQLSDRRALLPGEAEPLGPGEPEALGPLPGRVASAAGVPVPEIVLAHPATSPQRPIRATAKRLRMSPPYPGLGTYRAIRWYRSSPARTHRAQGSYRTVNNYARSVPEGGIELGRMRWWHVQPVLGLEHELFPEESWSAAAFWNELAETASRHYVVALLDEQVVGYAGLAVFGDEAHVLTIGVTGSVQRSGIGTALLRELLAAAGPRRVLLDVRVDNLVAQRLYERHGFVPVGTRRRYYQPSGTDALVMARERA